MKVSRADYSSNQEEHANSAVHSEANDLEQDRLADGTDECQAIADKVKFGHLNAVSQSDEILSIGNYRAHL